MRRTSSLSERKAHMPQKRHERANLAADYDQTGVKGHVSRLPLPFLAALRRAKTAPDRGTRYACA